LNGSDFGFSGALYSPTEIAPLRACYQAISNRCGVREIYEAYERYWEEIKDSKKSKGPKTRPMTYAAFSHVLETLGYEKKRSGPTGSYEWHGLAPIDTDS